MNTTTNYNLKKPEMSDYALIDDINDNMDILDAELASPKGDLSDAAVGAVEASTASYPIPSAGEKVKVILGKVIKFMTDIKKAVMNFSVSGKTVTFTRADGTTGTFTTQDTTYSLSSTSANGLMRKLVESSQTTRFMRGDGNWGTIQNNLTTSTEGYVLDARQGRALLKNHINGYVIGASKELSNQSIPANSSKEIIITGVSIPSGYEIVHLTGFMSSNQNVVNTNNWGSTSGSELHGVMRNLTSTAQTTTCYGKYILRRSDA